MKAKVLCDVGEIDEGADVELVSMAGGTAESEVAQGHDAGAVYVVKDDAGHLEEVPARELLPQLPSGAAAPDTVAQVRSGR